MTADDALKSYRREGFRLAETERAVTLVERALHGERLLHPGATELDRQLRRRPVRMRCAGLSQVGGASACP
jgi:hypothetical protein